MIRYVFVEEWRVLGSNEALPREILIQVDDRTFRRPTGEELLTFDKEFPGFIGDVRGRADPI